MRFREYNTCNQQHTGPGAVVDTAMNRQDTNPGPRRGGRQQSELWRNQGEGKADGATEGDLIPYMVLVQVHCTA